MLLRHTKFLDLVNLVYKCVAVPSLRLPVFRGRSAPRIKACAERERPPQGGWVALNIYNKKRNWIDWMKGKMRRAWAETLPKKGGRYKKFIARSTDPCFLFDAQPKHARNISNRMTKLLFHFDTWGQASIDLKLHMFAKMCEWMNVFVLDACGLYSSLRTVFLSFLHVTAS